MKLIELEKYGTFLSGRSRAFNAVEEIKPKPGEAVRISFSGVKSTAQSFVSELLVSLYKYGIYLSTVEFVNYENDHVQNRVKRELERLNKIISNIKDS